MARRVCTSVCDLAPPTRTLYDSEYTKGEPGDADVEYVVFSGGGMNGAAFCGVLQELESRRASIKYWIGSSAGAMIATMAALGASADFIADRILRADPDSLLDYRGLWRKVYDVYSRWGALCGDKLNAWYKDQIVALGWDPDITFADLYDLTGQHLVITATSLNTFETLYLSRSSYPYMRIIDAINATVRIPILFQPMYMYDPAIPQGHRILCDGGVLDNYPLNACDILSESGELLAVNRKAIGFAIISDQPKYTEIRNVFGYTETFVKAIHAHMHTLKCHQPYFWERTGIIRVQGTQSTDFGVDRQRLRETIEIGRVYAKAFLDRRDCMLQQHGPLPRNLFIPVHGDGYVSDDLLENTMVYQTNPGRFP